MCSFAPSWAHGPQHSLRAEKKIKRRHRGVSALFFDAVFFDTRPLITPGAQKRTPTDGVRQMHAQEHAERSAQRSSLAIGKVPAVPAVPLHLPYRFRPNAAASAENGGPYRPTVFCTKLCSFPVLEILCFKQRAKWQRRSLSQGNTQRQAPEECL